MQARDKFLWVGDQKLFVKGVTYGPFAPGRDPQGFDDQTRVARDFGAMADAGINTVRVYDAPPRWLLDLAGEHGLRVIAGLAWEEHIAFLDEPRRQRDIVRRLRAAVAERAGHPALLAWAIGNEIPSDVVRWHGRRAIERFLRRLADGVRAEDPGALLTYASYPSTEYLDLSFLDFLSFNVYLEDLGRLEAYISRLQNIAGERPLVLTEVGLDAVRHGELAQAEAVREQLGLAFAGGCAGAVVFAWTDEWHRGGAGVDDWAFGLTRRDGTRKPALTAAAAAFRDAPFAEDVDWPLISVVVCTYNGAATIADCLEGVVALDYPAFETIVVDDGSTDGTAGIAAHYPAVDLIQTENRGLSAARNTGLQRARGEIVAYLDDDARPDEHWLRYLARSFGTTNHAGVGGPNIQPPVDGLIARAIAAGPGGPIHVLLTDTEAEHIPGCNMAFRRDALVAVGGFDTRFRIAGDDVDLCWRMQDRGWTLGFSPAAVVEHRARTTLAGYWRQQRGYGRAEALLERKWPERYNGGGHLTWAGRVYGNAGTGHRHRRWRVYYGSQGTAPFQQAHDRAPGFLASLPTMPEWYLVLLALAALGVLLATWLPLAVALVPLVLAVACTAARAGADARRAVFADPSTTLRGARRRWTLTAIAHLMQPAARLTGRLGYGLAPWRGAGTGRFTIPVVRECQSWHEDWVDPVARKGAVEAHLRSRRVVVRRGGAYDRWDLEVRAGALARARTALLVEEHGQGRQHVRGRVWPHVSLRCAALTLASVLPAVAAARDGAWPIALGIALLVLALLAWVIRDAGAAVGHVLDALTTPPTTAPAERRASPEVHAVPVGEQR